MKEPYSGDLYQGDLCESDKMMWNLPHHIVWYVVMTFIPNYKEIRYLLFLTFA